MPASRFVRSSALALALILLAALAGAQNLTPPSGAAPSLYS